MTSAELLTDGYGRIHDLVTRVLRDATPDGLSYRPEPDANSVAWLVWHLTRIQDSHLAEARDGEHLWNSAGWEERFALDFDATSTGYGHTSSEVALLGEVPIELLGGYHDEVHASTIGFLEGVTDTDLDRIVDTRWDPPVTLGVRLISVLSDNLQHAGQALFVMGIFNRIGN
jgi:hypothetical protein